MDAYRGKTGFFFFFVFAMRFLHSTNKKILKNKMEV